MPGSHRRLFLNATLVLLVLAIAACKPETPASDTSATTATTGTPSSSAGFQPVMWKDLGITGFRFPEPEDKINGWATANDQKAMNLHAWGIWAGLTQETTETYNGKPLRVFETWLDPQNVIAESAGAAAQARIPRKLQRPNQFHKHHAVVGLDESTVLAFVKYDPTAAGHIKQNKLLSTVALSNLLQTGATAVPNFPNTGISLKPVFVALAQSQLVGGRYWQLATWPGSPQLTQGPNNMWYSKALPQSQWGRCVWIDIQTPGDGPGTGAVDTTCAADGSSRTDANTYGLGRFVHFQLTEPEAAFLNSPGQEQAGTEQGQSGTGVVAAGNYSVLVAMHVTSRETTRWTWQTFWWVPNPNDPAAPSSKAIADDRPPQLTGAPRNYAHCVAYSMEYPPQPNTGGSNTGDSVYCFNPYLEAPFNNDVKPPDLPDSEPGNTIVAGRIVRTPNNVGPQTNCMSCHARANYNPNNLNTAPGYSGDRYVDLNDPAFKGTLKVDFLWSLPGNAVPQPGPTTTTAPPASSTTTSR